MNKSATSKYQITFLLLLSIVLIVLDSQFHLLNGLHTFGARLAMPLRLSAAWPGVAVTNLTEYFVDKTQLLQQNTLLQQTLVAEQVKLQQLTQLQQTNQQLKTLLNLKETSQLPLVMTTMVSEQGYPYLERLFIRHQQTIDVGSAVLVASGVVGQVITKSALVDTVMPIVDSGSGVPVQMQDGSLRAIAQGDGKNDLVIQHIVKSSALKVGEQWVTSGLGGIYPSGYAVGTIVAIVPSDDHLFLTLILKPSVNLTALDYVAVVGGK